MGLKQIRRLSQKEIKDYVHEAARDGYLTRQQLSEKIERLKTDELYRRDCQEKRGAEQYKIHLESVGVDGLSALPDGWRDEVVPKNRPEGKCCLEALNTHYKNSFETSNEFCPSDTKAFSNTMELIVKPFWKDVISVYKQTLECKVARHQVLTLFSNLAKLYETAYDGIFLTQVEYGDRKGFAAFQRQIKKKMEQLKREVPFIKLSQTQTDIMSLYADAHAARDTYIRLCEDIAKRTKCEFKRASIKHVFRAIEKTAMRADEENQFLCSNVYDVVRGALVYETMAGVMEGLEEVFKEFVVLRIKNRFVPVGEARSSGGWRDVVVNMHVKDDPNKHVLEVQIQLKCLLDVRKNLGGHFIYAKYRALFEALEVCGYTDEVKAALNTLEARPQKLPEHMLVDVREVEFFLSQLTLSLTATLWMCAG